MIARRRAPFPVLVLSVLCAGSAGCATYGEEGGGVRTWQVEPADRLFGHWPPHERIRVVTEQETYVLEGARLEADSVIGFREEDDRWERVALPVDEARVLEVKKLNVELTALRVGGAAAIAVLGLIAGQ